MSWTFVSCADPKNALWAITDSLYIKRIKPFSAPVIDWIWNIWKRWTIYADGYAVYGSNASFEDPKSALLLVEMAWSGDVDVPPGHAGKVDVKGSTWAHPAGKGDIGASAAAGGYLHLQHYHHSHPWCQSANQGTTEWAIAGDDTMACVWLQPTNWSWDGQANFTNLFRISSI